MTAIHPGFAPMLARLARELPEGDYTYEPKWDGFRCLAFRDGGAVELRSRNDRPLARYFPEIVEALLTVPEDRFALDGEIVAVTERGFDFVALLGRLHPAASRVARMRIEAPASYVTFDALSVGDEDLTGRPFIERRARLEQLLGQPEPPLHLTPATRDIAAAQRWLAEFQGRGVDGVVAKADDLRYEPGVRAMVKVKHERAADCVVGGMRPILAAGGGGAFEPLVASLILGLYDKDGSLVHIGVASNFPRTQRRALFAELRPLVVPLTGHPWERGFLVGGGALGRLAGSAGRWTPDMSHDWLALAPERVCEIYFDQVDDHRLRHPARFRHWRPDRDARSCLLDQLDAPAPPMDELLR
jgi:ATP-dependent DNA ligase